MGVEELETGAGGAPATDDTAVQSPLDAARAARENAAKKRTITLRVAGYDGRLLVRYHAVEPELMMKLAGRLQRSGEREQIDAAADVLIKCCDAVLLEDDAGETVSIDPEGSVVTFSTGNLSVLLGYSARSARDEVLGLFDPTPVPALAMGDHAGDVVNWLQGKVHLIDQEALGE